MKLSELKKGDRAIIKRVDAPDELRHRFYSFGLVAGEEVVIKGCSVGKHTIEVAVGNALIALRKEEAQKIEVKKEETKE